MIDANVKISCIATNKLSSALGTTTATTKFIKEKLVNFRLAIPTIISAVIGASIGAHLSMLANERTLRILLIPILLIASFFVINKNLFGKSYANDDDFSTGTYVIASIASLVIGMYDGFYGPGTGTFLIIVLNVFAHLNLGRANAQTKVINLTTNITSLIIFIINGQVIWKIGLAAGIFGILGNYIGATLAIKLNAKITRPIILIVLALLFIKIITS